MSENFIAKNSPQLDAVVSAALSKGDSIGDSYERMKAELREAMGIVAPPSENETLYGPSALPVQPVQPAPQTHMRVVYPKGNARFEIYSDSEESLDLQEAKIRAMYQ